MSYSLFFRSPNLPFSQKQNPIVVPAGAVVSTGSSLRFTGKGAANYGKVQQENLIRLLENFAGSAPPDFPTVGQTWFDSTNNVLKLCVATAPSPVQWKSINSTQVTAVGEGAPTPALLGDSWFQRTGSASGVLYVYTGVGRYPAAAWDATTSGYFPANNALTLNAILNTRTYGAAGTDYNEAYIHGYTGITPANVDGGILVNSTLTTVPKGALLTSQSVSNGFVVWDRNSTLTSTTAGTRFFSVRQLGDGSWQYDDNVQWKDFTPTGNHLAIGLLTVPEADTNSAPGISSITLWAEARTLNSLTQVPMTQPGGAIGGWAQVYPQIDVGAGRSEYDYIYSLVSQLIGDSTGFGGNEALGKSIRDLTDFRTLDASLQKAWSALLPLDQNVLRSADYLNSLKVEPNSQDWDRLLAAAKYAISRLDLPAQMVNDISPLPFVSDGRPAPAALYSLDPSNVRYPSLERQVNIRPGLVTTIRQYQETVNVLKAGIQNRYILKGISGSNSGNAFNAGVTAVQQVKFTNTTSFSTSLVQHGLNFRFNPNTSDMVKFFNAGQAIELILSHVPSGSATTADTNLKSLTDSSGRIRLTADYTYIMSPNSNPSLSRAPIPQGFNGLTGNTTLATLSSGSASIVIRAGISTTGLTMYVDITAGGGTSGTFTATWNYINDGETYTSGTVQRVFPIPFTYLPVDKQGSSSFS